MEDQGSRSSNIPKHPPGSFLKGGTPLSPGCPLEVIKVSLIYKRPFRAPLFLDKGPAPQCESPCPPMSPVGSERPITIATPVAARAWRCVTDTHVEEGCVCTCTHTAHMRHTECTPAHPQTFVHTIVYRHRWSGCPASHRHTCVHTRMFTCCSP